MSTRPAGNAIQRSLAMGLLCAPVGILCGIYIWALATGEGYHLFPVYAGVAAFVTPFAFWWLLVARRAQATVRGGALAGALSGAVAHYVCWYLLILSRNACYWLWGGCRSSLGEPPIDPLNGLWGALALTFWSLLYLGWVTVPLAALIGAFLARRQFAAEPKEATLV